MEICIDTQILVIASGDNPGTCLELLTVFKDTSELNLAVDDHVVQEYNEHMSNERFGQTWLKVLAASNRITRVDRGKLKKGVSNQLRDKFHFSPDDMKFIRVALATDTRHLTSEDDDYPDGVKALLKKDEGVVVENSGDTIEFIRANQQPAPVV